ncbi:MAG TPA: hypothetical protein VMW47_07500 [Verrucomicrobiae bacterium]|nr:hypothetical protein [Verrucomicrobiae bacterium]
MAQEPRAHLPGGDDVTLRVRLRATGRFVGTVDEEGSQAPRGFDGWVDFMGAVAELRQRAGRHVKGEAG